MPVASGSVGCTWAGKGSVKGVRVKTRLKLAIVAGGVLAGALIAAPAQAHATPAPASAQAAPAQITPDLNGGCSETWLCAYDYNEDLFFSMNGTGSYHLDSNVSYVDNLTGYTVELEVWVCLDGNDVGCGFVAYWINPHSGVNEVWRYVGWLYVTS